MFDPSELGLDELEPSVGDLSAGAPEAPPLGLPGSWSDRPVKYSEVAPPPRRPANTGKIDTRRLSWQPFGVALTLNPARLPSI